MADAPMGIGEALILVVEPLLEEIKQDVWRRNPFNIVDPNTAALLSQRKQRDYAAMAELASRAGLNEDQFGLMIDALKQFVTPDDVMTALFRGVIDEAGKDALLEILGFQERERNIITKVAEVIPGVSDVVRFLTRDVFIPEFVKTFRMDEEFPDDAHPAFARLGMSKESAINFWRAHWELPGLAQGYEMFQRDKIDEVALRRLMRAQGVEPFWRDPLIAIAYNPLTRVDVRRIHKLLTKDKTWLIRQYRNTGYDDENANTLADFTIAFNSKEKKLELKDITDGLKSRVIGGVMSGSLKESDGRSLLASIGYDEKEITAFITEAHVFRNDKHVARLAVLAGDLYVKGRMTKLEATERLREAGFGDDELALQFREWDMEIKLKAPSEHELKERDLTRSEILAAYNDGIFTQVETQAALKLMRYDEKEIATLIAIEDFKRKAREDREAIEVVHQKFLSGAFDEAAANAELDKLVKVAVHKSSLILKWTKEHKAKTADIPLSSVQEIYQRDIGNEEWTRVYLGHMGFDTDERDKLLKLWTTRAQEKAAKDAAAAAKHVVKTGKGIGAP